MRLFVAVDIDNAQVLQTLNQTQSQFSTVGRFIAPTQLHCTLFFMGEVPSAAIDESIQALSALRFRSFEIQLQGLGAFPNPTAPRVVWLGTDQKSGALLSNLALQVSNALSPLGFTTQRRFHPHITIMRIKNSAHDISKNLAHYHHHIWGNQLVRELTLKQSVLTSHGARYSNLATISSVGKT